MAKVFSAITPDLKRFIAKQHLFFVASAPLAAGGHINVSPKGLETFRILSPHQVAYLDLTGSGNETAAHLSENSRITLMFCSFEAKPCVLRLYGIGRVLVPQDADWPSVMAHFDPKPVCAKLSGQKSTGCRPPVGLACPYFTTKDSGKR